MDIPFTQNVSVTLDANGNGKVFLGPRTGVMWLPISVRVQNNSVVSLPTVTVYSGSPTFQDQQIDTTITNVDDTTWKVLGKQVFPGQGLWAVWAGGDSGVTATMTVYGTQITDYKRFGVPPQADVTPGKGFDTHSAPVALNDIPIPLTTANVTAPATPTQKTIGPFFCAPYQSWTAQIKFTTAPATPYMGVNLIWSTDPAGTIITKEFDFVLDSSNAHHEYYFGHGPMYGPYLRIIFENYDSTSTTFQFQLFGSNRVVTETSIESGGVNVSPSNAIDGVLASQDGSLATNASTATFQCSYYSGPVTIRLGAYGNAAANTLQCFFKFEPASTDFATNTSLVIAGPPSIAGKPNDVPVQFYFPRRPVSFSLTNFDTATVSYRVRIIAKAPVL